MRCHFEKQYLQKHGLISLRISREKYTRWVVTLLEYRLHVPAKFWQSCHSDLYYRDRRFFKYSRRETFNLVNNCEHYYAVGKTGARFFCDLFCSEIVGKFAICSLAVCPVRASLPLVVQPLNVKDGKLSFQDILNVFITHFQHWVFWQDANWTCTRP